MNAVSEFPALEEAAQVVDRLDPHRQRMALAFVAERYGWNIQPAAKKVTPTPIPNNRRNLPRSSSWPTSWTA